MLQSEIIDLTVSDDGVIELSSICDSSSISSSSSSDGPTGLNDMDFGTPPHSSSDVEIQYKNITGSDAESLSVDSWFQERILIVHTR